MIAQMNQHWQEQLKEQELLMGPRRHPGITDSVFAILIYI
jgi:hypothetical protein